MKRTVPVLELKNISKDFGTIRALCEVSFDLGKGKALGFVGDNGAGRSTLLQILSGSLQPSSGEIYLEGERTRFKSTADAMKKGIAIAYQFSKLVDIATVWENFFMGRERTRNLGPFRFLDVERMKRCASQVFADYGHVLDIERETKGLSGGQRRLLAITRAIEAHPEIFLLDEPTHGLSKRVITDIFDILRKAKKEKNTSIIITSQWFEQISDFVDEVIVLRRGKIAGRFDAETADKAKIFKLAMGLTTG